MIRGTDMKALESRVFLCRVLGHLLSHISLYLSTDLLQVKSLFF